MSFKLTVKSADYHNAECRALFIIMLNGVMLSVIILSAIMLYVVAIFIPFLVTFN